MINDMKSVWRAESSYLSLISIWKDIQVSSEAADLHNPVVSVEQKTKEKHCSLSNSEPKKCLSRIQFEIHKKKFFLFRNILYAVPNEY